MAPAISSKGQASTMSTARANTSIPITIGDTTVRIPHGVRATISTSDGLRINVVPTRTRTRQHHRPKASVSSMAAQLQRVESIVRNAGKMGATLNLICKTLQISYGSRDYWVVQYRIRQLLKSGRLVQLGSKGQAAAYHLSLTAAGEEG